MLAVWLKHRKNLTVVHISGDCFLLVCGFFGFFFVKETTDVFLPSSFLLALCIGKHQNCMEHGVEEKFP